MTQRTNYLDPSNNSMYPNWIPILLFFQIWEVIAPLRYAFQLQLFPNSLTLPKNSCQLATNTRLICWHLPYLIPQALTHSRDNFQNCFCVGKMRNSYLKAPEGPRGIASFTSLSILMETNLHNTARGLKTTQLTKERIKILPITS